jgi:glycosyl hydrolase family 18 (putative chitinase)
MAIPRKIRPGWLVYVVLFAALAGIGVTFVALKLPTRVPPGAVSGGQPPEPVVLPRLNVGALPTTVPYPARPASCKPKSLAGANGTWFPDWLDNPQLPSTVPAVADSLNLVNFDWLGVGRSPTDILYQPSDPGGPTLADQLQTADSANPCAWRMVTVSDVGTPMSVMAKILVDPKSRWAHVMALAQVMAAEPQGEGLTLDYEFSLPNSVSDLATYAAVAGWHNISPRDEIGYLTTDYTELVRELAVAMHHEHRLLSVAVEVRETNELTYWDISYASPFLYDYGAIASYADQIVFMATDFHYSTSDPGPIVPTDDLKRVFQVMGSYNIPRDKLAIEVPNYGYDWPVTRTGALVPGAQATPVTATTLANSHWLRTGTQGAGTSYEYSSSGQRHIVWFADLGAEVRELGTLCPGCTLAAWSDANSDPVGSQLITRILGG